MIAKISNTTKQANIKFDDYIPIEITFGEEPRVQNYWRLVSEYSLLEIGVFPETGELSSIKVVQAKNFSRSRSSQHTKSKINGIIQFEPALWKNDNLFDEKKNFEIILNDRSVVIELESSIEADTKLENSPVSFGLSKNKEIVWIAIDELTHDQVNKISLILENENSGGFL